MLGEKFDLGPGFWKKPRILSGKEIDLIRRQNIVSNAKTIDRTESLSCVISHKSTDLRRPSYQNPQRIYWLGMRFVKLLAEYEGEVRKDQKRRISYHLHWAVEKPDSTRILEWFIPLAGVLANQEKAVFRVVQDAKDYRVQVNIFRVPE